MPRKPPVLQTLVSRQRDRRIRGAYRKQADGAGEVTEEPLECSSGSDVEPESVQPGHVTLNVGPASAPRPPRPPELLVGGADGMRARLAQQQRLRDVQDVVNASGSRERNVLLCFVLLLLLIIIGFTGATMRYTYINYEFLYRFNPAITELVMHSDPAGHVLPAVTDCEHPTAACICLAQQMLCSEENAVVPTGKGEKILCDGVSAAVTVHELLRHSGQTGACGWALRWLTQRATVQHFGEPCVAPMVYKSCSELRDAHSLTQ